MSAGLYRNYALIWGVWAPVFVLLPAVRRKQFSKIPLAPNGLRIIFTCSVHDPSPPLALSPHERHWQTFGLAVDKKSLKIAINSLYSSLRNRRGRYSLPFPPLPKITRHVRKVKPAVNAGFCPHQYHQGQHFRISWTSGRFGSRKVVGFGRVDAVNWLQLSASRRAHD